MPPAAPVVPILLKGESYTAAPNLQNMRLQEVWHWAQAHTLYLDASVLLYDFEGNFQDVVDYNVEKLKAYHIVRNAKTT